MPLTIGELQLSLPGDQTITYHGQSLIGGEKANTNPKGVPHFGAGVPTTLGKGGTLDKLPLPAPLAS